MGIQRATKIICNTWSSASPCGQWYLVDLTITPIHQSRTLPSQEKPWHGDAKDNCSHGRGSSIKHKKIGQTSYETCRWRGTWPPGGQAVQMWSTSQSGGSAIKCKFCGQLPEGKEKTRHSVFEWCSLMFQQNSSFNICNVSEKMRCAWESREIDNGNAPRNRTSHEDSLWRLKGILHW